MSLKKFVQSATTAGIEVLTGEYDSKKEEAEKLRDELDVARRELDHERRRAGDYFRIIEELQDDRNRWREMFHTASQEHLTAQCMMEKGIENAAVICGRMLELLNGYRKKAKQEPWNMGDVFKSMPKASAAYSEKMKALVGLAPEPVDGVEKRDAVK